MRNLKKILALVLALMMTLSLMVTANASSYTDADQVSDKYEDAVEVLSGMGVFQGDDKGLLLPKNTLTRREAAVLVYRLLSGDVEAKYLNNYKGYAAEKFSDVSADAWYEPYVAYSVNGNYIQGDGKGHFNPNDDITGTEVLAILLRAVGYDKNGEFSQNWPLNVATLAKDLGVTNTVSDVLLTKAVSREVVAELIFRTITGAKMVNHTPAFGYQPVTVQPGVGLGTTQTLGLKIFDLKWKENFGDDVWGRPGGSGWTYNTGDKKTVTYKPEPVAKYTTKVDECDIADDLDLDDSADIVSAYIDGVPTPTTSAAVTTNRYATIDPLATTSYVGAQGRLTEIYAVKGGYRIVEINTWLAKVTSVKDAYTDKNDHIIDRQITVQVYTDGSGKTPSSTTYTVVTDDFAKGDYVLVTVKAATTSAKAKIVDIESAPIVSGGIQTAYKAGFGVNPNTITVSGDVLKNADKFFLNLYNTKATIDANKSVGINWNVIQDSYGNVIGLVEATVNYLVIEQASWDRTSGTIAKGQALADVVLADGTREKDVVIAAVGDKTASYTSKDESIPASGTFTDNVDGNVGYYGHLHAYTVNADGSYNITKIDAGSHVKVNLDKDGKIASGGTTINNEGTYFVGDNNAKVRVNDNTVFLVADDPGEIGTTYTPYRGKDNVPTLKNAEVCYLKGETYATVVVVTNYIPDSSEFDALVHYTTHTNKTRYVEGKGYEYEVYKIGETEPTTVYYKNDTLGNAIYPDGVYTITLKAGTDDVIEKIEWVYNLTKSTGFTVFNDNDDGWARSFAEENDGNTLVITNGTKTKSVWVNEADYIVVVTDEVTGELLDVREGSEKDTEKGSWVAINYSDVDSDTDDYVADYVYVFKSVPNHDATADVAATSISVKLYNGKAGMTISDAYFEVTVNYTDANGSAQSKVVTLKAEDITWARMDTDGDPEAPDDGAVFVAGRVYRATVAVSGLPAGVVLDKSTTASATMSGATATLSGTTLTYQFTRS